MVIVASSGFIFLCASTIAADASALVSKFPKNTLLPFTAVALACQGLFLLLSLVIDPSPLQRLATLRFWAVCFLPHHGQKILPSGISLLHLTQFVAILLSWYNLGVDKSTQCAIMCVSNECSYKQERHTAHLLRRLYYERKGILQHY